MAQNKNNYFCRQPSLYQPTSLDLNAQWYSEYLQLKKLHPIIARVNAALSKGSSHKMAIAQENQSHFNIAALVGSCPQVRSICDSRERYILSNRIAAVSAPTK